MITDEYIAGFFDGEGCVTLHNVHKPCILPKVVLYQKKREVLDLIREELGYGRIHPTRGCWRMDINGKGYVRDFLLRVQPYVIVKRPQVELALEMQDAPVSERPKFRPLMRSLNA